MTMTTRREVLLALGALALLPACGDDDATPMDAGGACSSTTTLIDVNHGHVLTVSGADVAAGAARTYDIMGAATHTHSVTVSAADFATLASTGMVVVTSTTGAAHMHSVTVTCG